MFEEKYEKLGMMDKENFRKMVNWLLGHSFLNSSIYDFTDNIRRSNPDYLFVERNFELFSEYFAYAGFHLVKDSNYGVIALASEYDANHVHFDKLTTLLVYGLRLIYEEEREKLSLSRDVFTTTGDLVHKLISVDALPKKPANMQIRNSLRTLARFQMILKVDGVWENAGTRYLILPSILFIVSNERIGNMHKLIESDAQAEETAGVENAELEDGE
ncbi:MAG: DUF4194 domain-containing protein [Lachnospiraceae bacterium]|nr:DUF4194 domain-containing protein [Lachnospiraceae bacterium]